MQLRENIRIEDSSCIQILPPYMIHQFNSHSHHTCYMITKSAVGNWQRDDCIRVKLFD
jgi:hypothetical protein